MGKDALAETSLGDPDEELIKAEIARARHPFSKKPGNIHDLRDRLKHIMWNDVGIMRTAERLERAIKDVRELKSELMETGLADHDMNFNLTWHDWLNMRSLVEISETIAIAALSRENSRGAHFREDFPEEGDLDTSYFTLARQKDGELEVVKKDVDFSIVKPGESLVEDMSPVTADGHN
jgi:fumarate reductase flavoprotein subunit